MSKVSTQQAVQCAALTGTYIIRNIITQDPVFDCRSAADQLTDYLRTVFRDVES